MSYVSQTLATDEHIVERANFNWTYSFEPFFWLVVSLIPLGLITYSQISVPQTNPNLIKAGWIAAGSGVLLSLILLIAHLIIMQTTEIVITTYRFVYKTGLISRDTKEVSLNKIEEITLQQSVWGRLFGYGQLTLRGTGVGVIELPNLDDPVELRKIIETAKSAMRRESPNDRRNGE